VVEIDEFAVLLLLYLPKFQKKVDIVVHYDHTPFWISADTSKNDLCARVNRKCDFRRARMTVETQKYYEIRAMNSDKATDLYTVFLHRQTH